MKSFLDSLRADLLDRRFLPVLALLGVALVAALAFAVLGGGSSTSSPPPVAGASSGTTGASGAVAISQAPAANEAVSETTSGAHKHSGAPRDPFTPLPSTTAKPSSAASTSATPSSSSSQAPSSSSSSGSSTSSGGSPASKPAPKPAKPKPPQKVYQVDVLFGAAPVGTPSQGIPVTPFNNLTRLYPLAVNGEAPLVFTGVTAGGASAIFTIVREVFPHGPAVCHPSASQCEAIQLKPGQSEELEYIPPSGQALVYRLQLVSITAVHASAAKAAAAFHSTSRAGRALLRGAGLSALPGLRYSAGKGVVIVPGAHHAFAAHAASRRRRRS
jgi:hypothetical protein